MLFSSKDLRKLIIPLMFEQLLAVLVGLVDTLMVSQSGEAAVAGVALTWLATATIATGSSIYLLYDGLITNADELHDRLMKEIDGINIE